MTFRDVSAFNVSGKVSELQVSFLNVSNDVESLKRLGYLSRVTSNRFIYDSDIGRMLYTDSTSAISLNISLGSALSGNTIHFLRYNTGSARIIAGPGGVTIHSVVGSSTSSLPGNIYLRARYSSATLINIEPNVWVAVGDLSTS